MHSIRETGLSIIEFAEYHNLNPWYLAQIGEDVPLRRVAERRAKCDHITYEYDWQDDRLSRGEFARAIGQAENAFAQYAEYYATPTFIEDEEIQLPLPMIQAMQSGRRLDRYKAHTTYGQVQKIGTRAYTFAADVEVQFYDRDGDDLDERFYIEVAKPDGVSVDELFVFYTSDDVGDLNFWEWQVRPLDVTYDSNTDLVRFEGYVYQIVMPDLMIEPQPESLSALNPLIYAPNLAVYRVYVDTTLQGTEYVLTSCEEATETMCYGLLNRKIGQIDFAPSLANNCKCVPSQFRLGANYLSGIPLKNRRVEKLHAEIICLLAAAYLRCLPCGCACGDDDSVLSRYWEVPSFEYEHGKRTAMVTMALMENPFGPQYGAIRAYELAKNLQLIHASAL
jgi:hypothetical protein